MFSSVKRMWFSCVVSSTLVLMSLAAGQEYLPPNKGYNYDRPSVPFETNHNGNKQPAPGPGPRPIPTTKPTYLPPGPTAGPAHEDHDHDHHHHHEPGMPFDFSYQVSEDGNDYSHNAISDGDITRGEYRVALPDGRTQIVKYTADWKNGFNAEVTYEGEARYPDPPTGGYGSGSTGSGSTGSGSGQAYLPPTQGGGYQY